jgi:hypothetical protein
LAPDEYYPRAANNHRGCSTFGELDETSSDGVDEFDGYGLLHPPSMDEPIPEGLQIELTPVFVEGLERQLLG